MSEPKQGDFDLDEDLFDFGGVGPEPEPPSEENLEEIFATFRAESASEELAAAATAVEAEPAEEHAVTQASAPVARPAPRAPEPAPAPTRAPAAPREPAPAAAHAPTHDATLVPAPRLTRYSKGLVAIALSVTVLNAGLAFVLLRGRPQAPETRSGGEPEAHAAQLDAPAAQEHASPRVDPLPDPESITPTHGHPTLDEAREELARGDHAAARRRVYGLLAIVDRLEAPRRNEIEAECQYLIAQSLHLEALARMGEHE